MKKSKSNYEDYLNGLYTSEETLIKTEHCWAGNDKSKYVKSATRLLAIQAQYGTILKRFDPIAFEVGYNDWKL